MDLPLHEYLGRIDIYLLDQVLRQRITSTMRVLDAGCGGGRNLALLTRMGCQVYGCDRDPIAVDRASRYIRGIDPTIPEDRFWVAPLDDVGWPDQSFDVVVCTAVLHFADDAGHWHRMVDELWRLLPAGGLWFARLATSIGIEDRIQPRGNGWFDLPDGSSRFLTDEEQLLAKTASVGGRLADPLKTTNVQGLRCMTTWVAVKTEAE